MNSATHIAPAATLAVLAALASTAAFAQVSVTPRASIGQQDYSLVFADVTGGDTRGNLGFRDGFEIEDRINYFGGGLTFSRGRLFVDLSGQISQQGRNSTTQFMGVAIDDAGNTTQTQPTLSQLGPAAVGATGHIHLIDNDFRRKEYNLSVGWGFTPELSAFVGYKTARLDIDQIETPATNPAPNPGDVLFTGGYDMRFKYDGAFLGVTYSVPVGGVGSLSFQSSIARLSASFAQTFSGQVRVMNSSGALIALPDSSFRDGVVDGDSTGFNIGVAWSGDFGFLAPAASSVSYTLGVDYSTYEFDSGNSGAFWAADFEEKNTRLRLDLRYRFGGGED